MADEPQEQASRDPLDIAADLLYGTLHTLQETSLDKDKRETAANVLRLVQATALIDAAKSLRAISYELNDIKLALRDRG